MRRVEPEEPLFGVQLPAELVAFLWDSNPWWRDRPMRDLPPFRRWLFEHALHRLLSGLAPVTVLRGPRQVGKTTLHEQIIQHLVADQGVDPRRIFRVQFDETTLFKVFGDPVLGLCRWFEANILGGTFNERARAGEPAFLFLDEVQNLDNWAPQVKAFVDHHTVRVLLTGSSALRIERGRDSLAGRISTLEMGPLTLREIAVLREYGEVQPLLPINGLDRLRTPAFWEEVRERGARNRAVRDQAFAAFSERGGYPVAQVRSDESWEELADYLNETVIRRVIQHDLRASVRPGRKRDESLLEEVLRLCCRYVGQSPGRPILIPELAAALGANVGWQRVLAYLRFLDDTLLIRLIQPLEIRLKRQRSRPKIALSDHALRASWLQEVVPVDPEGLQAAPHLTDLAGHIAESIVGSFFSSIPGLDLAWSPERGAEPEVDFVITVGENRIPLEIKYRQRIDDHRDTLGLRAFLEKTVYNAPFGVLITLTDDVTVRDPRIVALPLSSVLLMR